jgi:hypothetical protein
MVEGKGFVWRRAQSGAYLQYIAWTGPAHPCPTMPTTRTSRNPAQPVRPRGGKTNLDSAFADAGVSALKRAAFLTASLRPLTP